MKKIVILILLVLMCSGCNGTITREIRHQSYSMNGLFKCGRVYSKDKNDPVDRISFLFKDKYINQRGELYDISLNGIFSNNESCKKSGFFHTIKAIYNSNVVKAEDDLFYYIEASNEHEAYSLISSLDENYNLYYLLLKDEDILKVEAVGENSYYVLKMDGSVYNYVLNKEENTNKYSLVSMDIVYDVSKYGKIVDFNYSANSLSTYLISNKGIYRMYISNKVECSKYVDIDCKYEFGLNKVLTKYKDKIIAYNGNNIITDYEQIFSLTK